MKILLVGASGATGRLLVGQLLNRGHQVKVIVRDPEKLPESLKNNDKLSIIIASVLDLSDEEMAQHAFGCDAVASCLGHTINFKGIYGQPHRLVTDTAKRFCKAIKSNNPGQQIKYVLINTTGNRNRDLNEPISFAQKAVLQCRVLLAHLISYQTTLTLTY